MPPWSDLAVHVAGFALYLGALFWASRLARPVADPDSDEQARFARAARLPIWALIASVCLGVYALAEHDLIPGCVWTINAGAAVLFIRQMRRVHDLERSRLQNHRRAEELRQRITEIHEQRNNRYGQLG